MGQQGVPHEEVPCLQLGLDQFVISQLGMEPIAVLGLGQFPCIKITKQVRHTLKATHLWRCVNQRHDGLYIVKQRFARGIDIPVQETIKFGLILVGRVQIGTVDCDPQVFTIPHVNKSIVDGLRLAVIPQCLVVIGLNHARAVEIFHPVFNLRLRIPGRGVMRVHLLKLPQELFESLDLSLWDDLRDDRETVGLPILELLRRHDTQRQGLFYGAQVRVGSGAVGIACIAGFVCCCVHNAIPCFLCSHVQAKAKQV